MKQDSALKIVEDLADRAYRLFPKDKYWSLTSIETEMLIRRAKRLIKLKRKK